jgi:hypothetical protein
LLVLLLRALCLCCRKRTNLPSPEFISIQIFGMTLSTRIPYCYVWYNEGIASQYIFDGATAWTGTYQTGTYHSPIGFANFWRLLITKLVRGAFEAQYFP